MDLKQHCDHLHRLGKKSPSKKARLELEKALQSKREGIQVVAAKALANWGDPKSIDAIKLLLVEKSKLEARWSAVGAISKLLYPFMNENDIDWVLELYLKESRRQNRFALIELILSLPYKETEQKLIRYQNIESGENAKDLRYALSRVRSNNT